MAKYSATKKFKRIANLNKMQDAGDTGVTKVKRKLADTWMRRKSNNVSGTFNRKHAVPGACITLKG